MTGVGRGSGVPSMVDNLEAGGKFYKTVIQLPCFSGQNGGQLRMVDK